MTLEARLAPPQMLSGRRCAPEQATGPPDTLVAGDMVTAWASANPDGQPEWLELQYEKPVTAHLIEIYESYNPGAVTKITAWDGRGQETVVWQGADPLAATTGKGIASIVPQHQIMTDRIRVYLASDKVLGWNEIDAVGLRYGWGRILWAKTAVASSTFGMSPARQNPGQIDFGRPW